MWHNILWEDVLHDNTILFNRKEFRSVLKLLNGETMSDYVDFFFTRDIVSL